MNKGILNKSSVYQQHGSYWSQVFSCESLVESREEVFKENKILHVGCTDYPFDVQWASQSLESYCEVDGVDTDKDGIDRFRQHSSGDFFYRLED